jgi:hypothetical protein
VQPACAHNPAGELHTVTRCTRLRLASHLGRLGRAPGRGRGAGRARAGARARAGLQQIVFNFAKTADAVSGPVAIVAVGAEVARADVSGLFQFAAIVNINLAVVNLLPLPVRAPAAACGPARAPRPGSAGPREAVKAGGESCQRALPCVRGWRAAAPAAAPTLHDCHGSLPAGCSGQRPAMA